jgi:hypothetical protein
VIIGDFHIHSTFSDGKLTIPQIVDLYGSHGFGAIAITDHLCEEDRFLGKAANYLGKTLTRATFPIYQEILQSEIERAWQTYRMVVLPGVEFTKNSIVNHRSSHILGLGIFEYISADQDIVQLTRAIRSAGGVAVAAHPLSPRRRSAIPYFLWDHREEFRGEFDAWEICMHQNLLSEVIDSDLPKIASSDFHSMKHFSSWKTVFDCERHPSAILENIRRQRMGFKYFREKTAA